MALTPIEEAEYRRLKAAEEAAKNPPKSPDEVPPLFSDILRLLVRRAQLPNEGIERLYLKVIDESNIDGILAAGPASKTPPASTVSEAPAV